MAEAKDWRLEGTGRPSFGSGEEDEMHCLDDYGNVFFTTSSQYLNLYNIYTSRSEAQIGRETKSCCVRMGSVHVPIISVFAMGGGIGWM